MTSKYFFASGIKVEMERSIVEKILRRMKVKSLAEYVNIKLQQDLGQML